MSEPTREQIKEAFKKTIERWEKIVEDVDYYNRSSCLLCDLFPGFTGSCDRNTCPIGLYTQASICEDTPYWKFSINKTSANALAELNFLRKVYIWWMEGEGKDVKEEKKEEWEDVTNEINFETDSGCMFIKHRGSTVAFNGDITATYSKVAEIELVSSRPDDFKFIVKPHVFRVLKKT